MPEERLDLKVVRTGREYPNVPRSQVVQWLAEKRLADDDLVKSAGARQWWKISMAAELLGATPGQTPTANQARWQGEPSDADDLGIEAPARTRPRQKLRLLEDSVLDMTPMIDVTFQMLIFFMFTNQLANPSPILVPEAVYGQGVSPDGKQAVLIDEQGRYYLGESAKEENIEPSLDSLLQKIADNAALSEFPMDVIINAHKDSKHVGTRQLMEKLSEVANVGQIRLGVEERQ
ncbi:MAG: biopolymer transporter ExbD [Rhodospirillaceae bacterium]|nr:biopolymer transporter ExbD [Rhodospirillaceae bacterium]